ncbi:hypothetical protein HPP92_004281 [Vanilla planifolia]|uniref:Nitronate monooxygenase n=1 Tax=Vanilla planifolia TaxID=51239 RepID=A0A835S3D0_VANPL|nr:hypothetical protein HPP92_004281 [Vanilla planifolia]
MGWRGILGFEYGIIQGPLGPDISSPELVSAVANAGAIGTLRAPDWEAPEYVRELIGQTRALTNKQFGICVVLAFPHKKNIKVILEEKVSFLLVSWGEYPRELVSEAHDAGVKIIHQVGCVEDASKAIDAGVDAIIVQSREAGGHVLGQDGLMTLIPRVVDLAANKDIPVIAAGGIVDSRGYVAALALGAHGICLGTRFVATVESFAHPLYKSKLVEYEKTDWRHLPADENEDNQPVIGHSKIHGMCKEIKLLAGTVPNATTTGDIESMVMYAGAGVGLIHDILPAAEVINRLVVGAKEIIQQQFSCD